MENEDMNRTQDFVNVNRNELSLKRGLKVNGFLCLSIYHTTDGLDT